MLKQDGRKRILEEADLAEIDYSKIDNYNFDDTPTNLRPHVMGGYLSWCYADKYQAEYRKNRKSLSQALYARRVLHVNPMNFSGYKNGERMPSGENLDNLAKAVGNVIYDIVGVPRKMPNNPILRQISEDWNKLSRKKQEEVLNVVNNLLEKDDEPKDKNNDLFATA